MINIAKFPLKSVVPICIPSSNVHECLFPHSLANGCVVKLFNFCQLTGEKWYLRVILICFFVIMTEVEHVFVCLKAICISFM